MTCRSEIGCYLVFPHRLFLDRRPAHGYLQPFARVGNLADELTARQDLTDRDRFPYRNYDFRPFGRRPASGNYLHIGQGSQKLLAASYLFERDRAHQAQSDGAFVDASDRRFFFRPRLVLRLRGFRLRSSLRASAFLRVSPFQMLLFDPTIPAGLCPLPLWLPVEPSRRLLAHASPLPLLPRLWFELQSPPASLFRRYGPPFPRSRCAFLSADIAACLAFSDASAACLASDTPCSALATATNNFSRTPSACCAASASRSAFVFAAVASCPALSDASRAMIANPASRAAFACAAVASCLALSDASRALVAAAAARSARCLALSATISGFLAASVPSRSDSPLSMLGTSLTTLTILYPHYALQLHTFPAFEQTKNRPFSGRFHYWLPTVQVTIYRRRFNTPGSTLHILECRIVRVKITYLHLYSL